MEILAVIAVIAIIWWFIANNQKSVKDETVIKTTRTVKIDGGEQTITRTTVMNHNQTDIRTPSTPITPPVHEIVEPTPRELELERELTLAKQREKAALEAQKQAQLAHIPAYVTKKLSETTQIPELKECQNCKRTQPKSSFRANHNQPDGLTKWCISCLYSQERLINPATLQGMKFCPKCRQNRRKSSFYPTSKYADGLSKWCKFCLPKKR